MSGGIGLIVGSGFAALELAVATRIDAHTPYGPPSGGLWTARLAGLDVTGIARHGETHAIAPHEVNYRANLWALHEQGVRCCLAVNVVGTIAADFHPGGLAAPVQLIDYTWGRAASFGGADGGVVHAEFAEPFSPELVGRIVAAGEACGERVLGGVYGVTQGPRLETVAEIDRLERDGCTMVGMTAMPEAVLARELGMDYAIVALGVNFAAGRGEQGAPIHGQIERYLRDGMQRVARVLERLVADLQ